MNLLVFGLFVEELAAGVLDRFTLTCGFVGVGGRTSNLGDISASVASDSSVDEL